MLQKFPHFRMLALVLSLCGVHASAGAQTVTLTVTNNGPNSGAVGVQPNGNVCNPNPGGSGGGTCTFSYPVGTPIRLMANSPNTPGIFNNGTGDASGCGTSVCTFTLNVDSAIFATFDAGSGPHPSLTINLQGDGKGNVGADNNQCQNFEFDFSACTTYYAAGSNVMLQGRNMPGNIFGGYSGGTGNAACTGTANCSFPLTQNSSIDAAFSALASVAVTPNPFTTSVGSTAIFSARGTFTNGMTRFGFGGNSTPWRNHVGMDVARFSLAAAVVGDRMYAFGGVDGSCSGPCAFGPLATVEAYDPTVGPIQQFDNVWTPRASMGIARDSLAGVAVNGLVYAIGGHTIGGGSVASVESFDPAANAWSPRASMSSPRARLAAAAIGNTIYAIGGSGDDSVPQTTVEAYDVGTNTWTLKAPMTTARDLGAAAAVNGILYAIGGDGSGSVEAYDPVTNTWSPRAPMPNGGGAHTAVALNGLIYAIGGPQGTMKVYNPAVNSWLTLGNMPSFQGQFALAAFDGRLFAVGGNLADNSALATLNANRPPEATWWSSNSAVGRIQPGNNGNVSALAPGSATISARFVTVDSGANSALLNVTAPQIFLNMPSQAFAEVGQAAWGCATFNQNASGPWTVTVNYGDNTGDQAVPFTPNAPPGTCFNNNTVTGAFFFNHAYASAGNFQVTVTVRNTSTNQALSRQLNVQVEAPEPPACVPIVSNIAVNGTVPFDRVHVAVYDRVTGTLLTDEDTALPLGFFDDAALPAGQYRFEFTVPDGYMVTPSVIEVDAACNQAININLTVQAIPPAITVTLSPDVIWPPNNKMVPITATITTSAPGGHATTVQLVSVTHNEGAGDVAGASIGTDDRQFEVRAKRNGSGAGRTYTATYRVIDTVTGATATATATVFIAHDLGR